MWQRFLLLVPALGVAVVLLGQRVVRGEEVLATQTVLAACTTTDGRPIRFPPELLDALERDLATTA